jgi:hypothetical protein
MCLDQMQEQNIELKRENRQLKSEIEQSFCGVVKKPKDSQNNIVKESTNVNIFMESNLHTSSISNG